MASTRATNPPSQIATHDMCSTSTNTASHLRVSPPACPVAEIVTMAAIASSVMTSHDQRRSSRGMMPGTSNKTTPMASLNNQPLP